MTSAAGTFLVPVAGGVFALFFVVVMALGVGALLIGIVALVEIAQTPVERFGPWWDNTKQTWLIDVVVGFVVPASTIVAGIHWYLTGRRGLHETGVAGRPFWAGSPRPAPPYGGPPPAPPSA